MTKNNIIVKLLHKRVTRCLIKAENMIRPLYGEDRKKALEMYLNIALSDGKILKGDVIEGYRDFRKSWIIWKLYGSKLGEDHGV